MKTHTLFPELSQYSLKGIFYITKVQLTHSGITTDKIIQSMCFIQIPPVVPIMPCTARENPRSCVALNCLFKSEIVFPCVS